MPPSKVYPRKQTKPVADTLYIGIDEAGYGPDLGPLVLAATTFLGPGKLKAKDWWRLLGSAVGRAGSHRLVIDDSKRVYSAQRVLESLGRTVHGFLSSAGMRPGTLAELLTHLDEARLGDLHAEYWYSPAADGIDHQDCVDSFDGVFERAGLHFIGAQTRVVFPAEFNPRLDRLRNKAQLEVELVTELATRVLRSTDSAVQNVNIFVDRLGGRRYYRAVVEDIAGDVFPQTIEESAQHSTYRFESTERCVDIAFRVDGDAFYLPVALASMFAKYVRELSMKQFNAFWMGCVDGLAPTAGYPADSRRFYEHIRSAAEQRGIPADHIWRRRRCQDERDDQAFPGVDPSVRSRV